VAFRGLSSSPGWFWNGGRPAMLDRRHLLFPVRCVAGLLRAARGRASLKNPIV